MNVNVLFDVLCEAVLRKELFNYYIFLLKNKDMLIKRYFEKDCFECIEETILNVSNDLIFRKVYFFVFYCYV